MNRLTVSIQGMQAQVSRCQPILQAVESFASVGHPYVLRKVALAVNKGHLLLSSFLAQQLVTQGSNLC